MDSSAVVALLEHVGQEVHLPRFRALAAHEVEEKSPGELVTVVDREAEALLVAGLAELAAGVPVVGEEGVAADPAALSALHCGGPVLLVDPLDGTRQFVAGEETFAVMVALVEDGVTIAGWIHQPVAGVTFRAERGAGAYRNGARLPVRIVTGAVVGQRVVALTRFFDPQARAHLQARGSRFARFDSGTGCAGIDYPALVMGGHDVSVYMRTLPWDHAAGALLVEEVGGSVRRLDGQLYRPGDGASGLLVTASADVWERTRDELFAV